jgi:hypothetical protein
MTLHMLVATPPDAVLSADPALFKVYGAALLALLSFIAQRAWKLGRVALEIRDEWRDSKRLMTETRNMIESEDGKSGLAVDVRSIMNQRLPAIEGRLTILEDPATERRHRTRRARDGGDSA